MRPTRHRLMSWRVDLRNRPFALRKFLVVIGIGVGSKGVLPSAQPAGAHSIVPCGNDSPVVNRRAAPGDPTQVYKVAPGLTSDATAAATNSVNSWAFFSDVSYTQTTSNFPAWDVYLTRRDLPGSPNVAGNAEFRFRSPCVLEGTYLWYNQAHIAAAGGFADTDKRCIYVHEVGHSLGLGHSNIAAHNDTDGAAHPRPESIMRGAEHDLRCHVADPPLHPRSADSADVNAKY